MENTETNINIFLITFKNFVPFIILIPVFIILYYICYLANK